MKIARRNQQLLFTLLTMAVLGLAVGYLLEKGIGNVGQRSRVVELAGPLSQCTTQEEYLAFVRQHYPADSPIWASPAMADTATSTPAPARLEQLRDGRLRVVVFAVTADRLLEANSYVYLPAALVDASGHGCLIEDVRLNSRKTDLVFEYYYRRPPQVDGRPARDYRFFLGRRQWTLQPIPAP